MVIKNIYDVIRAPRISAKAYVLNKAKQLVLEVHPQANKPMIYEALKKLFGVTAESVRVIRVKGKRRRVGRNIVEGSLSKKAIITLKEGQDINLGMSDAAIAAEVAGDAE